MVLHDPIPGAKGFSIMPLSSKNIHESLIPNSKRMELLKEGFGITVLIKKFTKYFTHDRKQKVTFDNAGARRFWKEKGLQKEDGINKWKSLIESL